MDYHGQLKERGTRAKYANRPPTNRTVIAFQVTLYCSSSDPTVWAYKGFWVVDGKTEPKSYLLAEVTICCILVRLLFCCNSAVSCKKLKGREKREERRERGAREEGERESLCASVPNTTLCAHETASNSNSNVTYGPLGDFSSVIAIGRALHAAQSCHTWSSQLDRDKIAKRTKALFIKLKFFTSSKVDLNNMYRGSSTVVPCSVLVFLFHVSCHKDCLLRYFESKPDPCASLSAILKYWTPPAVGFNGLVTRIQLPSATRRIGRIL